MKYRDRNPSNMRNWKMLCGKCDHWFRDAETVQVAKDHFDALHAGVKVELRLTWVGLGPAPKKTPSFLN